MGRGRRQPSGPDLYEEQFARTQAARREQERETPKLPLTVSPKLPPRPRWQLLLAALVLIVIAATVRGGSHKPPKLATSCTTPALALSRASVTKGHRVDWSATGPAGTRFQLFVGVASFTSSPTGLRPVPDQGRTVAQTEEASHPAALGKGCTGHSWFTAVTPPGHYTVRMFRFDGTGASLTATEVASRPLTVTAP